MSKVELALEEYEEMKKNIAKLEEENKILKEELSYKAKIMSNICGKIPSQLATYFLDNIKPETIRVEMTEKFENLSYRVMISYEVNR